VEMQSKAGVVAAASLITTREIKELVGLTSIYEFECFDKYGNLKWEERVKNLITNEGLNDVLNKYFKGSAYTAAWYVGLKATGSPAAGDTLASHAGWSEITGYSGSRKALTLGTVASQSVDNDASKASFTFTGSTTVFGAFVASAASGTSGILYSVANFASSRAVETDDVLNVKITLTLASA
jgi:hypothetical protein